MPINANIPLSVEQQPTFNQNMAGLMSLNEMAQKKQMNDMAIQDALQQRQAQAQQQQKYGLLQQAYKNSLDEKGQVDRKKFLPEAYKIDYNLGLQAEKEFNTMDKAQADIQALHDTHSTTMQDLIKKQNEVKKFQDEEIAATNKTLAQFGNSYLNETDPQKKELYRNYLQKTIAPTLAYKNDKGEYVANGLQLPEDPAQFDAAISQYVKADPDIAKQMFEERKQTEIERKNKAEESTAKINAETNRLNALKLNMTTGEKESQFLVKRKQALSDALDPTKPGRGSLQISKQIFDRAERLESLASAFEDSNLDSRQIEELAIGLNSMLQGSNVGAQRQVEALVPKSAIGNVNKLREFLTNNPQGTGQQEFVKRMLGTIEREKKTAQEQMIRSQSSKIAAFDDIKKSDPEGYNNILKSFSIDPDEYENWKAGGFKPKSAVQGPESKVKSKVETNKQSDSDAINQLFPTSK